MCSSTFSVIFFVFPHKERRRLPLAVTIKDIALAAGVSRGTVDRVLNGRGKVRPQVAERVLKLAAEMKYLPNRAGRELAAIKRSIRVGLFLPGIDNNFFGDVLRGAQAAESSLSDYGASLLLRQVKGYDVQTHAKALQNLLNEAPDGLCAATVDVPETRTLLNDAAARGIPVIAINTDLTDTRRLSYVGCDYANTGRTAAGLFSLLNIPSPRLLIFTGSHSMQGHNQRIEGFRQALRERGIPWEERGCLENQDDDAISYRLTRQYFSPLETSRPNCLLIAGAGVEGACQALEELGLGQTVKVLTFDEVPATRRRIREGMIPATVCQEPFEQGYRAVKLLFDYLVRGLVPPDRFLTRTIIKIRENLEEEESRSLLQPEIRIPGPGLSSEGPLNKEKGAYEV